MLSQVELQIIKLTNKRFEQKEHEVQLKINGQMFCFLIILYFKLD